MAVSEIGRPSQSLIFSRIAARVPWKQRDGAFDRLESYPAPLARGILFSSSNALFSYENIRLCENMFHIKCLRIVEEFDEYLLMSAKECSSSKLREFRGSYSP